MPMGLAISGQVELVITLGTGFGSALFMDGKLVPNWKWLTISSAKETYEQQRWGAALDEFGSKMEQSSRKSD